MAFKMNTIKYDLCSYPPYILLGERKIGKTTFWRDLVTEAWGKPEAGLLISCGTEEGYHALDNLQYESAPAWNQEYDEETGTRGLVQIVDDLIENNAQYGIRGVCLDTFDTLVDIATVEVLRMSRRDTGKVCKSLNEAYGGYGRGMDKMIDIIKEQISRLRSAGLAVFIISHIKFKERTDKITGDKYEILTNNLFDKVYTSIADNAQMVMLAAMDRDINNGKIENERRSLYLRGTSTIDAGGRFNDLPEKVDFTPQAFLAAFKQAVKSSASNPAMTDSELSKLQKDELKQQEQSVKIARKRDMEKRENEETEQHRAEYLDFISKKFLTADESSKSKAANLLTGAGYKKFSDPEVPASLLKTIAEIF